MEPFVEVGRDCCCPCLPTHEVIVSDTHFTFQVGLDPCARITIPLSTIVPSSISSGPYIATDSCGAVEGCCGASHFVVSGVTLYANRIEGVYVSFETTKGQKYKFVCEDGEAVKNALLARLQNKVVEG